MPPAKLALAGGLLALALAGCGGVNAKPAAPSGTAALISRGRVDDPRTTKNNHLQCLREQHLSVREVGATGLQIGVPPAGPQVEFAPTPGAAQADQIAGRDPGAEVIGSALVFPNQGSDGEMQTIESCLAKGVQG